MNLQELLVDDTIETRIVRGIVNCDLCETSTKLGFRHGILTVCIHCHFEVVESRLARTLVGV